jgi:hypothetical protein
VARVAALAGEVSVRRPGGAGAGPAERLAVGQELPPGAELEAAGANRTPGGAPEGRAALRLAGGAEIRLDGGTRLRLRSAAVLELERGAVYVDSGADSAAERGSGGGLAVRTPAGVVRDVGTQFEVRLPAAGDPALRVRVRSGAVEVDRGGDVYPAAAGTELTVGADGSVTRGAVATHGDPWAWAIGAAPRFAIEGRTLAEFLAWVARETGREIRFADPGLEPAAGGIVLHGTLGEATAEEAPAVVLPGAGLRGRIDGGVLVVTPSNPPGD